MVPPALRGKTVDLRPVREADLQQLMHWYNEPDTFRYMGRDKPLTINDQQNWHSSTILDPASLCWAIERRDTSALVGSATLRNLADHAKRAEFGILLGVSGSGFGSDAISTVLSCAFGELDMQCVSIEVHGDNRRSMIACMRVGFRPEGILRRRLLKDGTLHDLYSMSILRDEFEVGDTQ